jgi:hypothetical protein
MAGKDCMYVSHFRYNYLIYPCGKVIGYSRDDKTDTNDHYTIEEIKTLLLSLKGCTFSLKRSNI